jgi:hypothetical protein
MSLTSSLIDAWVLMTRPVIGQIRTLPRIARGAVVVTVCVQTKVTPVRRPWALSRHEGKVRARA